MSRSRKRIPIFKWISDSNKASKRLCNSKFRIITKRNLKKGIDLPQKQDEIMTEWEFHGDGRRYIKDAPQKYMRK